GCDVGVWVGGGGRVGHRGARSSSPGWAFPPEGAECIRREPAPPCEHRLSELASAEIPSSSSRWYGPRRRSHIEIRAPNPEHERSPWPHISPSPARPTSSTPQQCSSSSSELRSITDLWRR